MSTKPDPDESRLIKIARADATEAMRWLDRIPIAVTTMRDHAPAPLHAKRTDGSGRGSSDHPIPTLPDDANSIADRKRLVKLILERDRLGRGITRILDAWAPRSIADSDDTWCENHLMHGNYTPRRAEGGALCRWCYDTKLNFGKPPTRKLIELHDKGRRISEADYRRHLDK